MRMACHDRPMTPPTSTGRALHPRDWGDRRLNLEFVTARETHPFVAEADGGSSGPASERQRQVGWIGTIWVEPAWRRRASGWRSPGRRSRPPRRPAAGRSSWWRPTPAGRSTRRIGFEVQTWYRILEAPGLRRPQPVDPRVRPFEPATCRRWPALDAAATGEDRPHLLGPSRRPRRRPCLVRRRRDARRLRRPCAVGRRRDDRARPRATPRRSCTPVASAAGRRPGPRRAARRERGRSRAAARDRLDESWQRAAPDPRRAAELAARGDLGAVQPRPRLSGGGDGGRTASIWATGAWSKRAAEGAEGVMADAAAGHALHSTDPVPTGARSNHVADHRPRTPPPDRRAAARRIGRDRRRAAPASRTSSSSSAPARCSSSARPSRSCSVTPSSDPTRPPGSSTPWRCSCRPRGAPGHAHRPAPPGRSRTPESWEIHLDGDRRATSRAVRAAGRTGLFSS